MASNISAFRLVLLGLLWYLCFVSLNFLLTPAEVSVDIVFLSGLTVPE